MRRNDRAIARFTMIGHATFHSYELAIPLFVVVWLDVFDVSPAVLGTVVAVGYGLVGVGALPSGALADAYGSKRLVVLSMAGMGAGFALVALAPTIWILALALVCWGAAASLYHPAGLSLITRGAERRGTVLAYHGVAGNVGTA
ncbi:MFS transporter, partial [Halovivax sp.]|uniref:MFS transporter n=1 Tax=Halovivax sp. TaxID=1935978 RepID=UPI0025C06EA7